MPYLILNPSFLFFLLCKYQTARTTTLSAKSPTILPTAAAPHHPQNSFMSAAVFGLGIDLADGSGDPGKLPLTGVLFKRGGEAGGGTNEEWSGGGDEAESRGGLVVGEIGEEPVGGGGNAGGG